MEENLILFLGKAWNYKILNYMFNSELSYFKFVYFIRYFNGEINHTLLSNNLKKMVEFKIIEKTGLGYTLSLKGLELMANINSF